MMGKSESNGDSVVQILFDDVTDLPKVMDEKKKKVEKKQTIKEIDAIEASSSLF